MTDKKWTPTSAGLRKWIAACRYETNHAAADDLGVSHRTFDRWLMIGVPATRPASKRYRAFIVERMGELAASRKSQN